MGRHDWTLESEELSWAELYELERAIREAPVYRAMVRSIKGERRMEEIKQLSSAEDSWENEGGAPAYEKLH